MKTLFQLIGQILIYLVSPIAFWWLVIFLLKHL